MTDGKSSPSAERVCSQGSAKLLLLRGGEDADLEGYPGITLQEAIQSGISSLNLAMLGITN